MASIDALNGMQAAGMRASASTEPEVNALSANKTKWPSWVIPASIVLFGLALRLYRLDHQSYWGDEVGTLALVKLPWAGMHAAMVKDVVHPPLHYYLLHEWCRMFGFGTLQGRLLSVIFGTLAIPALYFLAKLLFNRETALVSALLLAVSQLGIQYSQETRAYAQLLLLTICSAYLFLRALKDRSPLYWWLFVASAVFLEYTHYFGVLALISFGAFGVLYQKTHPVPRKWWICGGLIIAAFMAAWLASGVMHEVLYGPKMARELGTTSGSDAQRLGWSEHWSAPFAVINVFNNGRPHFLYVLLASWRAVALGSLIFSLPAVIGLTRSAMERDQDKAISQRENTVFLLLLFAMPVVISLTIGMVIRIYVHYLIFCVAPYYVLVARGMTFFRGRFVRPLLVTAAVVYAIFALRANYFVTYKEDFRGSEAYLAAHSMPGDCYVVLPSYDENYTRMAWEIYERGEPELTFTPLSAVAGSSCSRVWLIGYTAVRLFDPLQSVPNARKQMDAQFTAIDRQSYFGFTLDLYQRSLL